jgi:hypothetical protein
MRAGAILAILVLLVAVAGMVILLSRGDGRARTTLRLLQGCAVLHTLLTALGAYMLVDMFREPELVRLDSLEGLGWVFGTLLFVPGIMGLAVSLWTIHDLAWRGGSLKEYTRSPGGGRAEHRRYPPAPGQLVAW